MSRWFRFYDDAVNDPKIIKLSDDIFRAWVNLLCVASKHDGALPAVDDVSIILRVKASRAAAIIAELVSCGLLDKTEKGFAPHNWNGRQYKSDVSTERVKRFRNGQRNVSETPPDTEQKQITEQKIPAVAKAPPVDVDFEDFWKSYPRREGANPKEPAAKLFRAAVKGGENPRVIVAGAKECAIREAKNVGTPYIPQAVKWLRDKRWQDYNVKADQPSGEMDWENTIAFYAKTKHWSRWAGPEPGQLGCKAPADILHKHGIRVGDAEGLYTDIAVKLQAMQ